MKMLHAIPALPVKDMEHSVEFYRDKLGFTLVHREEGFAIFHRDAVDIHLWAATDESWRSRRGASPIVSGAESFIAGTASCRIALEGVEEFYQAMLPLGILHTKGHITDTPWGTREFGVVDPDNNLKESKMNEKPHVIEPNNRPSAKRPIAIVGAASSIGIRPYDNGAIRGLDQAPRVLRELGLVERLAAHDRGDVDPPPYQDFVRPTGRPRNEEGVAAYSRALAEHVAAALADGAFVLVLGGDCSIVLGCLLGLRRSGRSPVGLTYVDAHADFATPEESRTGSVASMCLGLTVGRGDTPLARLGGEPLAQAADVVLIGRRDQADPWYGHDALRASAILDLPHAAVRERGMAGISRAALDCLARADLAGFWIHFDADVLDPDVMPAVDSPEPGGLGLEELAELLTPLVRHPRALGLELTIYDPTLDSDHTSAARLVTLLEQVLIGKG